MPTCMYHVNQKAEKGDLTNGAYGRALRTVNGFELLYRFSDLQELAMALEN